MAMSMLIVSLLPLAATKGSSNSVAGTATSQSAFPKDPNFRPAQAGCVVFVVNDATLIDHTLPAMTMSQATLGTVLDRFSRLTKTNLVASWAAMARKHISGKVKRDIHLPAQSYKDDLVAALKLFAPRVRMVITAQENVIFLTTRQQDDETLITRTYWLSDLIGNLPRIIRAGTNLENLQKPGDKVAPHTKPVEHPISTNILELLSSTVRPKIWINHGGKANITQVNNRVIVTAPASVQAILKGPSHYNPNAAPLYLSVSY